MANWIDLDDAHAVMSTNASGAAALLKALSNEARLMILCNLLAGEQTVSQLNEKVPLSQSALSQHLARLRKESLVAIRKEAQMVYYRINNDKVSSIIGVLYDIYCDNPNVE